MEREDGYTFDARIPPFSLESKHDADGNGGGGTSGGGASVGPAPGAAGPDGVA